MSGIGWTEIHILLIVAGFLLGPVIIAVLVWEYSPRPRITRWIGRTVLALLGVFAVYLWGDLVFLTMEQKSWYPQGAALGAFSISYAREGIVLDAHPPAGVPEVWQRKPGPFWKSWPWEPHYHRIPFRVVEGKSDQHFQLLIDHKFSSYREWGLAFKSQDGYWISMSPYFPDEPDLTDEEWDDLVKRSRLVVPDG